MGGLSFTARPTSAAYQASIKVVEFGAALGVQLNWLEYMAIGLRLIRFATMYIARGAKAAKRSVKQEYCLT